MADDTHALRRTSPKGKGQKFVGTCTKCGKEGLTLKDVGSDPCPNIRGTTQEEDLMEAILGEPTESA